MAGNKQVFWNEHIGGGQYRLRIQNSNANNKRAWWIFDTRTSTMRAAIKRNLVVSNQAGQGFRLGRQAVARPWKGEQQQRLHFYSGCLRNVRNDKGHCLSTLSYRNSNNNPLTFYKCSNRDASAWAISQIKLIKVKDHETVDGRFPVRDGIKFMIRSKMGSEKRMLYAADKWDSNRARRLRIRDFDANVVTAYWVFDSRTNTIRSAHYKNWALSNERGQRYNINRQVVVRAYAREKYQQIRFYGGSRKNIRNLGGKCVDVYQGKNLHNQNVIWYNCHNGVNQGWSINTVAKKPTYRQPLRDGLSFYIRSQMHTGKNIYQAEHIGRSQYRLRIRNFDIKGYRRNDKLAQVGWFTFDQRTRTIRSWTRRTFAISNEYGQGFNIGRAAVVRLWRREVHQRLRVYGGNRRNIRNDGGKCLDVHGGHNHNGRHLIFWNCHNGANQGWKVVNTQSFRIVVTYENPPIRDGLAFQFRSQHGRRTLFMSTHKRGNGQFMLKIQNHAPWDWRQFFVFDRRSKSIRVAHRRNYAISKEYGARLTRTGGGMVRPWRNSSTQRVFFNKQKNIVDFGSLALTL